MLRSEDTGPRAEYETVEIRISAAGRGRRTYRVELMVGERAFRPPPTTLRLDLDGLSSLELNTESYGLTLGKALFAEKGLGPAYRETVAALQGSNSGLRVLLQLDPPELQRLHWERIYHPIAGNWQPLGATGASPFSRYVSAAAWDRPAAVRERPLCVLAVIASPSNLNEWRLDPITPLERGAFHSILEDLAPHATVTYLETGTTEAPTLDQLRKALADGYHIIHFMCHGAVTNADTVLYLENVNGGVAPVAKQQLLDTVRLVKSNPLLCFLSACESAAQGRSDAFVPLAPALVSQGGIQAVVAMSAKVGMTTARALTDQFYRCLFTHGMIDVALNEARARIQGTWDWGIPVLFSRLPDNALLYVSVAPEYDEVLGHADRAFNTASQALAQARQQQAQDLVDNLTALIKELSKSHQVLVNQASKFRAISEDTAAFANAFRIFYIDFKAYADGRTWVSENASCHKIELIGQAILPRVSSMLDRDRFAEFANEIETLGSIDLDLIRYFQQYVDRMDEAVENINYLVQQGDVESAIAQKREFESQISPSFRHSKEMFERMTGSVRNIASA